MSTSSLTALLGTKKAKAALIMGVILASLITGFATIASAQEATDCSAYSQPLCADVPVNLPYSLDWSKDEGKLADKTGDANGDGTGFSMVQPSSNGGKYLPENLDVDTASPGTLKLTTTRGIQFRTGTFTTNANSLDNGLGVGFDAANKAARIETTIVNPPNHSAASEQAGLWFGPNEDNYVKLVIASGTTAGSNYKVQLMKEIGGGLNGNASAAPEQIDSSAAGVSLANRTVKLTLIADPSASKVDAYYSISGVNGGAEQFLGSYGVPANFFDGTTLNPKPAGVNSIAGIFATHRNRATTATPPSLVYTFDNFRIVDAIPPAAPTGLTANAGTAQVELDWADNSEGDFGGYNVYRGQNKPVNTSGTPLNGTPLTASTFTDATAQKGTNYYYAVRAVDNVGNASAASDPARAMVDDATPQSIVLPFKVNFQSEAAPVPAGYQKDYGQNYANTRGFGWVEQNNPGVPLNLVGNGRDRNLAADQSATPPLDQRLDTLMHMQGKDVANFANVAEYGAWEVALPNGRYDVELSVGDPSPGQDITSHEINVEGVKAIDDFAVTSTTSGAARFKSATVEDVPVNDGKLTIDAVGGRNTKINYVDISEAPPADTTPPSKPTLDLASASDTGSSPTDNLTKDDTPTFAGQAEAGSTVEVFADGASLGTAQASDAGSYDFTVPDAKALNDGTAAITADATDAAGNPSELSDPLNVTVDTTAPAVSVTSGPSGVIDQSSASFAFTAEEGSSVACELGTNVDQSCVSPKSYTDLDDGDYTFVARATDGAGNEGSATRAFTVNTPGPGVPVISSPANDSYDTDGDLTISGTAEADSTIELFEGTEAKGTATADTNGAWTITLTNVAEGPHTYAARATKNGKTSGESASVRVIVDTTDPGVPANLTAEGKHGAISLDWDDSPVAEDVAGYNVYRSDSETGTYTKLNGGLLTVSAFNDAPLPDETTRYYQVTAVDRAGNESERASKSATTLQALDETPPGAPTGLTATAGEGQIALDWSDNPAADGVAGYDVFRATSASGPFSKLNASPLAESQYTDTTVQNGTTYHYVVTAMDTSGNESGASNSANATPQASQQGNPLALEFDRVVAGTVNDKDGEGIGFTSVQPNGTNNAYDASKLDLQPAGGKLVVTATAGTNTARNDLKNALRLTHDGSEPYEVSTRLVGPLTNMVASAQQGGIYVGPDQDNYVKLVANHGGTNGTQVQFFQEINSTRAEVGFKSLSASEWSAIQTLDLFLTVNPSTGVVEAEYAVNGGQRQKLPTVSGTRPSATAYTIPQASRAAFFNAQSQAGILAFTLDAPEIPVTFERFEVKDVQSQPDTTAPAAPQNLLATAGDGRVDLAWNANTEGDIDGYNVYRGTSDTVDTSGTPLNAALLEQPSYTDTAVQNGTTYHYVVQAVDTSGNKSGASTRVSATPRTSIGQQFAAKVNFQSAAAPVPTGYFRDYGQGYGARTDANQGSGLSYGWVVPGTSTPVDLSTGGSQNLGNGRDRNLNSDQRLDTLMHMQAGSSTYASPFNGKTADGAWEIAVPNGTYQITVAAGDSAVNSDPERHTINVEGVNAIRDFLPSGSAGTNTRHKIASVEVTVSDGRLTIDATGGTNTKINYVDVASIQTGPDTTPPNAPANVAARAGDGEISVVWNANTETDLDGYNVYAGTSATGTPLNGATLLKTNFYIDRNLTNGTERTYVVEAVDRSGNKAAAQPVSATPQAGATDNRPKIISTNPADGATNVALSSGVAATLILVTDGVDESTFSSDTVKLIKVSTGTQVPASYGTSGGNDVINLIPNQELEPNTQYRFEVTDGVKDLTGTSFLPYSSTFTTGTTSVFTPPGVTTGDVGNAAFDRVAQPNVPNKTYTSVTMGPDNRLYAGAITGEIYRFDVAADGNLSNPQIIDTIRQNNTDCNTSTVSNNGCTNNRLIIGLTFEPGSTAQNPRLWVTHSFYGFNNMKDWGGKLSVLSGANLGTYRDVLVNLPRSSKDHLTNSIAFNNGKIYIPVGATTAMGAFDNAWKGTERLLSAAVIEVDYQNIQGTLDVKTADGGTYDPYATGAPVKIFATGVRNAVDLVWHSNGNLYTPTNGSAGGSNVPATPDNFADLPQCKNRSDGPYTGPAIPDFDGSTGGTGSMLINKTQDDYLFRVVRGGYYGNPNPSRCEWVLNGGNPTAGTGNDPGENPAYPAGTKPDRNWRGWAYDFKNNQSPNGVIEYKSTNFGGKLKGKLLVVRYSQGDDIIVLEPGPNGNIAKQNVGVPGLNKVAGSEDPLDLIEDTRNGNLYVTEGVKNPPDGTGKITLLRARDTGEPNPADVSVDKSRLVFNDVQNGAPSAAQTVTVTNSGGSDLTVSGASLSGANANQFQISAGPTGSVTLTPGQTQQISVVFNPTSVGVKGASLDIATNDADTPVAKVNLRGLGTLGTGGSNEPSLQWILDTYEIPINVGDPDPSDNSLPTSAILGDEVAAESLERAYAGSDVTLEPLAVFGPQDTASGTVTRVGNYASGQAASKQPIFSVANANFQSLNPTTDARYDFAPAGDTFGFYSIWPFFNNREVFSEDTLNTWETNAANRHKVRVYPLQNKDGTVEPNAYVVATEEHNSGFDYQDVVYIVRNVEPAGEPAPENQEIDAPQPNELVFSGVKGSTNIPTQSVSVKNSGRTPLEISGASTSGTNAGAFQLVNPGARTVAAGETATFEVRFAPGATTVGSLSAKLTIASNDADEPNVDVGLYGLSTNGEQGSNEPTLQDVVNTLGYPVRVHDLAGNPLTFGTDGNLKGEEVSAPLFQKAGSGNVTIKPVARYSPDELLPFGYYTLPNGNVTESVVATIDLDQEQTLNPKIQAGGGSSFDPGAEKFGIFVDSKTFNRKSYQQDGLNTGQVAHAVRVYPAKNRAGQPIANTYLVTFEDAANGDYQDYVFLVTNAKPAASGDTGTGATSKINFQPATAEVPAGYTPDTGQGYDSTRGFGWVTGGTSNPVDMTAHTRLRTGPSDQRLRTLILAQGSGGINAKANNAWEYAVPDGAYEVTLSVGDNDFTDSVHRVNVEGQNAINNFAPTTANLFANTTVTVNVNDGRLTLDFGGSTASYNTKLNYVEIRNVSGSTPESISQQASPGSVVTTDTENNNGATPSDPMETTITVPSSVASGTISINEQAITQAAPSGFAFFGQQANITGPAATAATPYTVAFELDPSTLPTGANENTIQMFRDGQLVQPCASDAGSSAKPDPCVIGRQKAANNDVLITVRTSGFSSWNTGVSGSALDTTAPEVNVTLSGQKDAAGAYRGTAIVNIEAKDLGGSGLDKTFYSLDGEPFKAYTGAFNEARDAYVYTLPVSKEGNHTIQARAIDRAGNTRTAPQQSFSVVASKAEIELENGDGGPVSATTNTIASTAPGVPFPDRLVMSRIQNPEDGTGTVPKNYVHDVSTLRVKNTGTDPLSITNLQVTGPFQLESAPTLPASVPAGGSLDIKVRFVATSGNVHNGTLTVTSDDADEPTTQVELSGFWQSVSEGGQEPDNVEINRVFGYGTTILYPGQQLNNGGKLTAIGDEIISPYWQRANTTKPVTLRQLAAFHTQGNTATFFWHAKGSNTTTGVLTHLGVDGQTILPRRNGINADTGTTPAYAEFTPSAATFGFKIDPEWSDWTKNNSQVDIDNGCTGTCGHHMRFWPVRDRAGKIIPNQYLVGMDYAGINYDFNDNVYLVTNIKPENAASNPAAPSPLPGSPSLNIGFDKDYPGTLEDKDGTAAGYQANTGTGFTSTQRNENDQTDGSDSYKPELLDIDTAAGTLAVRTFGTDTTGSNGAQDNTLVNGLRTNFDGSSGKFVVGTKLNGPLTNLNAGNQQGGVMFGPDQDNFVKLVAINTNGAPAIEFLAEQNGTGGTLGSRIAIPNPASVTSLELFLLGDPQEGTIRAAYRVDGGAVQTLPNTVTLTGAQIGRFFAEQAKGGIITQHKGGTETTVTFDNFSVTEEIPGATPEPQRDALFRLDVAGSGEYTDSKGNVWQPDTGFFSPSTAPNEGATTSPQEIANTDDDVIYRTYRGNVGNVAQDQRVLTYNLPTRGAELLDLRLHFAERASANNTPGKRVFDIEAEGKLLRDDFDIYAAAGGQNTAIALPLNNVAVKDGNLTLVLRASADYPSIAGIEVLCEGACPAADTTAPAAPTGLVATGSTGGIALDWANNAETDLAGYNVYRAASATGTFTKVNDSLVTASQYNDAQAPSGQTSYYQVKAVDASGNESGASNTANAARAAADIRINTGGPAQTVNGVAWKACSSTTNCSGYVSGGNAYSEADTITGIPQGMNNTIFQSEWTGGQASGVPVGQVAFTFNVPVQSGAYNVKLHFAELNKNAPNLRLFDVNIEGGALELNDFDVYAAAGGIDKAIMREFPTNVTDGNVTIQFITVKENAKISAIEILPQAPDTQAPAAPTGLTAAVSGGVALDWANNAEADLAGYNVYRSDSENGTYAKLNNNPLSASEYQDATASGPNDHFYQVKAVDKSGNESGAATIGRTLPAPTGFTTIDWGPAASQQFSNSEGQAEVVNGKLYTFGGFDSQKACCTPTKRAYVYDPAINNWSAIADLPHTPTGAGFGGVTHAGFTTNGTDIFMAGGYTSNATGNGQTFGTKQVYRYNVAANTYTRLPDLPVERAGGQLEVLGGNLYYFGGTNLARTQDVGNLYVLDLSNLAAGWTERTDASLPNPRHHLASVVLGGKIYAIGGQHGHDASLVPDNDVHVYDPQANKWTQAQDLPKAINHATASTFVMEGRIIVAGGQVNHGTAVADVTAYDPQANAWTPLTPLPTPRHSAMAGTINGNIYVATGGTATTLKGTTPISGAAVPVITAPAEGSYDADGDFTVSGTAEPGGTVELFEGTTSKGTATAETNGAWSIQLTGVAEGSHTYTARATVSGKTSDASGARTIIVDKTAPAVTGKTPAANATDVALGANVTATFSDEMTASTIDAGTFKLTEQGGSTPVPAAVTYDAASKTATLNPSADLKASASYAATVTTGIKDKAGNALAAAETWSFTTKAPEPQALARINTGGPALSTGGVSWGADQYFTGGKSYTNPSVTSIAGTTDDALYLNERSATTDLGSFSYAIPVSESGTYTARLHFAEIYWGATGGGAGGTGKRVFSANLEGGPVELANYDINADVGPMTAVVKSYDVTVTDGTLNIALSASINQPTVAALEVLKSSGTPADTTPPTVTGKTPAANATDVALGANVTATFSEAMTASTINPETIKLVKSGTTTPVTASVTYDAATKTTALNPSVDLEAGAAYTATVTTGAKDLAGNALASAETWSFTTADDTAPAAPTVRLAAGSDSGSSNTDRLTNDATPTFVGQAEAASKVELFDGTSSLGTTTASDTGTWSLTAPAALTNGEHTITATATDAANNTSSPSAGITVTIDTAAPQTILDASGPSGRVASTTAEFVFTSEQNASFECKLDAEAYAGCSSPKSYPGPLSEGNHAFAVRATDAAGNTDASPAARSWIVDVTAPTVSDVAPAEGATRAPASANVSVKFSEAMNAATINGTTFTLVRQGSATPVAATVTYAAATQRAILNPSADLVEQATYTARLRGGTSGVKDLAGNPIAANKVWSFTTDILAPSKLSATRSGSAGNQRVVLDWTDNSKVEVKYVVERSTTSTFTSNLVTRQVGANARTYRDTSLARNTRYYYRVFAVSQSGVRSDSSNVVSVVTR